MKVVYGAGVPTLMGLKAEPTLLRQSLGMVDRVNFPESVKEQDPRLLDGTDECWFQDNSAEGIGGLRHYRKDVDLDEFRFTVNQGGMTMLANGAWFTFYNTTFVPAPCPAGGCDQTESASHRGLFSSSKGE